MPINKTTLSKQETEWILEQRITRVTDQKEVLIYPMGAERYLSSVLFGNKKGRYDIRQDIVGKDVLVIPGYGNSGFLFAEAGAKSVTVYDKDPVTIAWMKAFKLFYHYKEASSYPTIGELLTMLTCWYPPLRALPKGKLSNAVCWVINPKSLRRAYIFYMLSLVRQALQSKTREIFELDKNLQFHIGEIDQLTKGRKKPAYDTAFVPYLLGVRNGIESEEEIACFMNHLIQVVPTGAVLITPTQSTKEFYIIGQRYFVTTDYPTLGTIPKLKDYCISEDKYWFHTQGLAKFGLPEANSTST
jgi:hypothetical protein